MPEQKSEKETPFHKKLIGIGLIGLVMIGLVYIFKKYGFSIPWFGPQTAPGKAIIYWDLGKIIRSKWKKWTQ